MFRSIPYVVPRPLPAPLPPRPPRPLDPPPGPSDPSDPSPCPDADELAPEPAADELEVFSYFGLKKKEKKFIKIKEISIRTM